MKASPHRETELYFDKVMIGSSVEAMVTAFKYGIPIFCDSRYKPLPYTYVKSNLDLSPLNYENKVETFTYLSGKESQRGIQKLELWNLMAYRLHMMGLMPLCEDYQNAYLDAIPEEVELKKFSVCADGKYININSDNIILFDYPRYQLGRRHFYVNDYIEINTMYDFPANLFLSKDCDFMSTLCFETIFYKRNAKMYGCCVKSIIHEDHVDEWDYSQTSVRMQIERDIFWNIDKDIKISLGERERAPMLTKMCENLEDIIHYDYLDEEFYD